MKTVKFDPVEARFVKFIAKDGTGDKNGTHGCAAEFNLYRSEADQPEEPTEEVSTAVLEYALSLTENVSTEGVVESVLERYNAALENAKDILKKVQDGDTTVTQEMVEQCMERAHQCNAVSVLQTGRQDRPCKSDRACRRDE